MSNQERVLRVFFAASTSGLPDNQAVYSKIVDSFEKLGHQVLPSWIVNIIGQTNQLTNKTQRQILEEQQHLLRRADIMVVESSLPSFGIGFLMSQALQERKPILCLYPETKDVSELSDMIGGNISSLIKLRPYNKTNLSAVIAEYCQSLATDDLHKFNFIASREVLDYIDDGADRTGKSKSEFLRDELTRLIRDQSQA